MIIILKEIQSMKEIQNLVIQLNKFHLGSIFSKSFSLKKKYTISVAAWSSAKSNCNIGNYGNFGFVQLLAPTYCHFCSFTPDRGNPKLAREFTRAYHLANARVPPPPPPSLLRAPTFPKVIISPLKARTICLKAGRSKATAPGRNYEDLPALSRPPVNGKHKR